MSCPRADAGLRLWFSADQPSLVHRTLLWKPLQLSIGFGELWRNAWEKSMEGMILKRTGYGRVSNEGEGMTGVLNLPCNRHRVKPATLSLGTQSSERMSNRTMGSECTVCPGASIVHIVPNGLRDQSHEMHCLPTMSEKEENVYQNFNF